MLRNENYQFCNKKVIIFEYLKNRKLKINKIFVCLGHTNLSFSSLDSLAPLFPECNFFLNCRCALQKYWKTASDFPFSLEIKWKTVHSLLKFCVKIKNFFRKRCVMYMCVPHQNFTFDSKIFNFNKKMKKRSSVMFAAI